MATVTISIPSTLRKFCDKQDSLEVSAETLGQAFESLNSIHPELVQRITTTENQLRPFVNIFIERTNSRDLSGMDTPLVNGQKITLMSAFAGG